METPDSLLVLSFEVTPDSVYLNYKPESGKLILLPVETFEGLVEIRITVTDEDGGSTSETIAITVTPNPTGINDLDVIPTDYVLYQNYPNPFNPNTTIRYGIPCPADYQSAMNVTLKIYDILGNEVATLVNEQQSPGYYEYYWNAGNLSSGIYFYSITAGSYTESRKMILLK